MPAANRSNTTEKSHLISTSQKPVTPEPRPPSRPAQPTNRALMITTKNTPCRRVVFVRAPQCVVHARELAEGVEAAHANAGAAARDAGELTDKGTMMLGAIVGDLNAFVRGHGFVGPASAIDFSPFRFFHDSSPSALAALKVAQLAASKFTGDLVAPRERNSGTIEPLVCFCSTTTIRDYLTRYFGAPLGNACCPPLGSVTMIDFFDDGRAPLLHCVNNTALYDCVAWWNNAP